MISREGVFIDFDFRKQKKQKPSRRKISHKTQYLPLIILYPDKQLHKSKRIKNRNDRFQSSIPFSKPKNLPKLRKIPINLSRRYKNY